MPNDQREISIIMKLKQQLQNDFANASSATQKLVKDVDSAFKKLNDTQKDNAKATKENETSMLKLVATLYSVEHVIRGVIAGFETAYNFAKEGAKVEVVGQSFERVTEAAGGTTAILEQLRQATRGTVSDMDLMVATNQSLVGTTGKYRDAMLESLPALTEMARASSILNPQFGDTTQQLDRLTLGLKRMEPRILDDIGLELRLTEVNKKYADQTNQTVAELDSEEKQLALLNAVMERQAGYVAMAGDNAETALDKYARLETTIKNVSDTLKTQVDEALVPTIEAWQEFFNNIDQYVNSSPRLIAANKEHQKAIFETSKSYQEYSRESERSNQVTFQGIDTLEKMKGHWYSAEEIYKAMGDEAKTFSQAQFDVYHNINQVTDAHDRNSAAVLENIMAVHELSEEETKWREQRDKSLNNLFLQQIKINQKMIDNQQDYDDKTKELAEDHNDRINRIARDGAEDRTRIAQREADDKAQIEQDYADRKAGLEKDLNELQMELEGKNPYVDAATTQAITDQEALLKATKSNLETLKRDAKNGHAGPSMDAEIQATEDLIRQTEDNIAQLKESAREQERRRRLEERIKEKQDEIKQAAEKKDRDLKAAEDKAKADIELSQATEKKKTDDLNDEYNKRRGKIEESFNKIKESAQQDLEIATVDSMLSIVDASSDVGKALTEMKFKQLGGTDEMINKFYQLRDSITGPGGVLQAIQMMNSVSVSSLNTGYYNNSGNYSGGISGRRAGGGSVSAGHSYLVGENGPEVLQMGNSSGHIIPNGGGGGTVVVNINAGAFLGNRSDAVAFGNMVGPIIADWQSRYGGATNARGTRNIRSNR